MKRRARVLPIISAVALLGLIRAVVEYGLLGAVAYAKLLGMFLLVGIVIVLIEFTSTRGSSFLAPQDQWPSIASLRETAATSLVLLESGLAITAFTGVGPLVGL